MRCTAGPLLGDRPAAICRGGAEDGGAAGGRSLAVGGAIAVQAAPPALCWAHVGAVPLCSVRPRAVAGRTGSRRGPVGKPGTASSVPYHPIWGTAAPPTSWSPVSAGRG